MMNLFITLVIFPGLILDTQQPGINYNWFAVILLTTFNFLDTLSRMAAQIYRFFTYDNIIQWSVITRIWFFVTFILIAIEFEPRWLFGALWFKILNVVLFGATNGYFCAVASYLGTAIVEDELKGRAGIIMSLSCLFGLFFGSLFQFFLPFMGFESVQD